MFCKVISKVRGAWVPVDLELFLCDAILDPIKSHIYGFGFLLFDMFVCKTISHGVVGLNRSGWLWVAQVFKSLSHWSTLLGMVENASNFDCAENVQSPVGLGDWDGAVLAAEVKESTSSRASLAF